MLKLETGSNTGSDTLDPTQLDPAKIADPVTHWLVTHRPGSISVIGNNELKVVNS